MTDEPAGPLATEHVLCTQTRFALEVPGSTITDGVITIRPHRESDLEMHLASIDDQQMRWLWTPAEVDLWAGMDDSARRAHVLRWLRANAASFAAGPKWSFAVDLPGTNCVAYVDCDLANDRAPHGEANISYSVHPGFRGRGFAKRAVICVLEFLRLQTTSPAAHIIVDPENTASVLLASSVVRSIANETTVEPFQDAQSRVWLRHRIGLYRSAQKSNPSTAETRHP